MVKSVMLLSVPRVKTEVICPGTPEGTTATPGTLINAWATLMYWLFSKSSWVITVVEVAVVSGGCAFRVAAVTTMVGSCVTAGCGWAAVAVDVLAVVETVFVFAGEPVFAAPDDWAGAVPEEVCGAGEVVAGSAQASPRTKGVTKLRGIRE